MIAREAGGLKKRMGANDLSPAKTFSGRGVARYNKPVRGIFCVGVGAIGFSFLAARSPVLPSSFPLFTPAMGQVGLVIPAHTVVHDPQSLGVGWRLLQDRRHQSVCLGQG